MTTTASPTNAGTTTRRCLARATLIAAALVVAPAAPALANGPEIERASYIDRFKDGFILDLCGIDTWTTVTEHWTSKRFPDGSETFHAVRTFVPDDPRIPIEKGAATSLIAPDGSRTTVGKPVQLFGPEGGVTLIDAGRVRFDAEGNVLSVNGPHPAALAADLAQYYCPR